ncbi:MAG: hypothetical protein ACYDA3_05315 [Gaiellaceae bacterium]
MRARLRTGTKVDLIVVALLLAVLGDGAAGQAAVKRTGSINTYRYEITVAGSGQTTSLYPFQPYGLMYTGAASGTFSVKYQVAITVDSGAQTIAAHSLNSVVDPSPNPVTVPTGVPHSLSVNGTSSFNVTASCAGPPCTGPSTTCAFSSRDIAPYYRTSDGRLYMPGVDQADHAAYASGTLWFQQVMNGTNPTAPAPTPCTGGPAGNGGGQAYSPINPSDIPGFTDGAPFGSLSDNHEFSPIPLSELGKAQISHSFTTSGDCAMDFVKAMCQAQVTVTMKLLAAPSTTLHVGFVNVSESERIKRLVAQLEPQAASLAAQKATLESQLSAQGEKASSASSTLDTLSQQLPGIEAAFAQDAPFLAQIAGLESQLPANVQKELRQEEEVGQRLADLQINLVAARDSGDQTTAGHLAKQVASLQKLLDEYVSELHGKLSSLAPTLDKWLTQTRFHQQQLINVQQGIAGALDDQALAADAIKNLNAQRTVVDGKLNDLVEQLLAVRFLPDEVTVTDPGGGVVFKADVSKKTAVALDEIDRDLVSAREAESGVEAKRKRALKDFLSAEAASSKALVNVSEVIWSVAQKKAAVDFIYNLYDVGKAASKGGLVGAVAETLKKVGEAVVKEYFDSGGGQLLDELRHPGILWPSAANAHYWLGGTKELNARYQTDAKLSNQYFADQALKLGLERVLKDSISGPGKDQLNQTVGTLYQNWWRNVPIPGAGPPSTPLPLAQQLAKEAKWVKENYKLWATVFTKHSDHVKELNKGSKLLYVLSNPKASGAGAIAKGLGKDLLANFFKDLSKNLWKSYYDAKETEAWSAYFEKEAAAQALYLPWQAAGAVYDSVHEYVQGLEGAKAILLQNYDPSSQSKVLVDKKFKTGTKLKIALKLFRPAGGTNTVAFDVLLGDRNASDEGKYAYSVATTDLTEGQGGLGLAITAR